MGAPGRKNVSNKMDYPRRDSSTPIEPSGPYWKDRSDPMGLVHAREKLEMQDKKFAAALYLILKAADIDAANMYFDLCHRHGVFGADELFEIGQEMSRMIMATKGEKAEINWEAVALRHRADKKVRDEWAGLDAADLRVIASKSLLGCHD